MRNAGKPTTIPITPAVTPLNNSAMANGMPNFWVRIAEA